MVLAEQNGALYGRAGPLAKQRLPDECRGMVGLLIYLNPPLWFSLNHQVMIPLWQFDYLEWTAIAVLGLSAATLIWLLIL